MDIQYSPASRLVAHRQQSKIIIAGWLTVYIYEGQSSFRTQI